MVVFLLGLLLGEAVHSFAILIEELVARIGIVVYPKYGEAWTRLVNRLPTVEESRAQIEDKIRPNSSGNEEEELYTEKGADTGESDESEKGLIRTKLANIISSDNSELDWGLSKVRRWSVDGLVYIWDFYLMLKHRVFWTAYDVFRSHRLLFARSIAWNFENEDVIISPWEKGEQGILYDRFDKICRDVFDMRITRESENEILRLYPLISSVLSSKQTYLSQRYQAIYSFCRGMWVVLLITLISYLLLFANVFIGDGSPLYQAKIVATVPSQLYGHSLILTGTLVVLFMYATAKYKRNYVEYFIADFCTIHWDDYSEGNGPPMNRIQRESEVTIKSDQTNASDDGL